MAGKNITDMTVGSPTGHIVHFALPLLLGNVFQQLYNMVDSLVVGNYVGPNALAAVGTCSSMSYLFFSLSSGLAIGIGILVAQYFGAKNDSAVRSTIANTMYTVGSAGLVVTVLAYFMGPLILRLLHTPETILPDALTYIRVSCLGFIAMAIYNGVASILRALGDSKTPLYFLILASLINVGLDLLFVRVYNMEVLGVALATVIAQSISAVSCLIYAYKTVPYFQLTKEELKPNGRIIRMSFKLGIPVALQNASIAVSMMVLQSVVNQFGETIMASYTIVARIEQLVQQSYNALGTSVTNYSGQNMGAGDLKRVQAGFRRALWMVLVFSICLLPITFFLGKDIIALFVKDPAVISIGSTGLMINSLCYFPLGMIYIPRSLLNGCGDTGFALFNGLFEVICRIVYSNFFTSLPMLGYWGIWVTTAATWGSAGLVCVLRYLSGAWKKKAVGS